MTEPLQVAFDVACGADHAFATWTAGIGTWWPVDHTVSGEAGLEVVLEGRVGGRIYERTAGGVEHDWGEVTEWRPPMRLAYRWHLGADSAAATDVAVSFVEVDHAVTRIEIEHRGWERLGAGADSLRDRNQAGWDSLLPYYRAAFTEGA
jgi:uncharacterized protein YndB with AHSA1/START domain